ncbi:hypothetical protein RZN22_18005 [Bacillaceae bacterium S4-13-58]
MSMFCYQCQETSKETGCTIVGVCGKKDDLANMQDLLIYTVKGLAIVNSSARQYGLNKKEVSSFIVSSLFMTITNANWSKHNFFQQVRQGLSLRDDIMNSLEEAGHPILNQNDYIKWAGKSDFELEVKSASQEVSILATKDEDIRSLIETGEIVGGFAHHQVSQLADQVVDAVKNGDIKRFFVMAGCDGRHKSRTYYKEFAEELPTDTVILTAGCAKYRYNKLELGDINGIPRVLDAGQCNDSYSLVMIALKLKEAFGLESVNELPLSYNIAWYEQKAVIVFLSLLHLGIKNIHVGPTLPAFLSPNVTKFLVENFGIGGISSVEEDMDMFMNVN